MYAKLSDMEKIDFREKYQAIAKKMMGTLASKYTDAEDLVNEWRFGYKKYTKEEAKKKDARYFRVFNNKER
jgi:hypothetical protein